MTNFIKKFSSLFKHERSVYVNAARVNDTYKKIERGSNQIDLINHLKLDYIIVIRRGKGTGTISNIDINSDQFKPSMHNVFVKLDQLNRHKELSKRIKALPDINNEYDSEPDDLSEQINVVPSSAPTIVHTDNQSNNQNNMIEMPLIELEEHERFTDINDQVVDIEVRGERSPDKIYFKALDVASYFEIELLIKTLLDDRKSYKYGIDYIICNNFHCISHGANSAMGIPNNNTAHDSNNVLDNSNNLRCTPQPTISGNGDSQTDTSRDSKYVLNDINNSFGNSNGTNSSIRIPTNNRINHDNVYLTLAGYIRVAAVSRSGNANIVKVFEWIKNLVYVHQFGSYSERTELAQDMLKTILNDRLSGLYCIDLGIFDDLYDTMNISRETYPPEKYGKYHLYKFGLSKDINTKLTQHQNKKDGYGRWSNKITLKWMILLSESQLSEGEGLLSEKFKAKGLSFNYTDESGKTHNELIAVGPKDDSKVKTIYKQTVSYFPSKENDLGKLITEINTQHELALLKMEFDYTKQLHNRDTNHTKQLHDRDNENNQLKASIEIQRLTYENKLLSMELVMNKLSLTK